MTKTGQLILTIAFLACPALSPGSYIIELNNGRQFVVNEHWKQDGMVAFYFHGGVVALPRDLVKTINESDVVVEPPIQTSGNRGEKSDDEDDASVGSHETVDMEAPKGISELKLPSKKDGSHKVIGHEYYRSQRRNLKARLEKATQEFRQASSRRDGEAKRKAIQDITAISKEMLRLSQEVEKKNDGVLPEWWHQP